MSGPTVQVQDGESMASNNVFKNIPSVNELLETGPLKDLAERISHNAVVGEVRSFLDELRREVSDRASGVEIPPIPSTTEIAEKVASWISKGEKSRLVPVINATGVLLHTGLGRAPLAAEAVDAISVIGAGYSSVEIHLESGQRGQRIEVVEGLLRELTGAESAAIVNNNAGATLITLAALAGGKEVIVSRGQLIEIGGSYRLPEVMSLGGTILREVGTTNKTRASDFEAACGESTAAVMRVHTSNYRIVGFTHEPSLEELVAVAHRKDVVMIDDIGSGALYDLSKYGLSDEPVAKKSIAAGADIVMFSGDKLLGGPQCGIMVGRKAYIDKIVSHPLMRALRVDKSTLAALVATLKLHRDPAKAEVSVPLMRLLATSVHNLEGRAERLSLQMAECEGIASATPVASTAQLGGGSVPAQEIPSWCVALTAANSSIDRLARKLRTGSPAVLGRIQQDRLLLDLRAVFPFQDTSLIEAVAKSAADRPADESPDSTAGLA